VDSLLCRLPDPAAVAGAEIKQALPGPAFRRRVLVANSVARRSAGSAYLFAPDSSSTASGGPAPRENDP
jgi:hypothetical protein